ncbi:MAG: ABC transporter ATP-binding protein [Verrucomicrobia bacterium]|nr:ABC transporter ATP-binding protein [Verrucomicrobiota bacterium]
MPVVVRAENLSKKYRLGVINRQMLVDQIESWVYRKLGKPDPHASIFEKATDRMPTPHDFWALKDLNFEIERGDIVGIMGRNGSGKSTLLKILSRITAPTTGKAFLHGRLASLLEVGTGFNFELTGKENVFLNGSILGLKDHEIRSRYDRIVEFAEIQDFMDTPVKRYSSGMRVRLAFAVAAHLDPEILILDEVLAVGDAKFQEKCLNRIEEIKNTGVTVLFVSHSVQSVEKLCTSAILLDDGRLVARGSVADVTERYLGVLGMKSAGGLLPGMPESRHGLRCGRMAEILLEHMEGGRLVFGVPVETPAGHVAVDVGWVSSSRLGTLRTEPSWSAAPDISVTVISSTKSPAQAETDAHHLLHSGARESWVFYPNGTLNRYKALNAAFLTPDVPVRIACD